MPRKWKSFWRIEPGDVVDFFTVNWALKLTALVLAFLLWTVVKADQPTRETIENVPVRIENRDDEWVMIAQPQPQTVSLTVSGPTRELFRLAAGQVDIYVPIEDVTDSTQLVPLSPSWVRMFGRASNVSVEAVRPPVVQLTFDRLSTTVLPLAVRLIGSPVPGFELAGAVRIDPPVVRVSGPARRVSALDSMPLPPVDLSPLSRTDTITLAVDTLGLGVIVVPQQVQVILTIEPLTADTVAGQRGASSLRPIRPGGDD